MTTRRRRSTGTIEITPNGLFRPRMPGRGVRLTACATREEAQALLDAAIDAAASGAALDPTGLTLLSWGEQVLDRRELHGIRSVGTDRSRWRTHIATWPPALAPIQNLTRADIIDWRDEMLAKHAAPVPGQRVVRRPHKLSRTTVQNTLNLLRVVLEEAVERGLTEDNPARTVRLPRSSGRTHEPWTYLLPEEQRYLTTSEQLPLATRLLIAFAIGTGMRQGEQWNLELRDVDAKAGIVTVRFGAREKATKSGKIRRVPLLPIAKEALDAWLPLLKQQPNPHGLLWPLPSGARRQRGKTPDGWAEALRTAAMAPGKRHDGRSVRWHDLRHTCASSLVAGWWGRRWSLEEVRELLGHSSVTVTERYAHLSGSAIESAVAATGLPSIYPPAPPAEPPSEGSKSADFLGEFAQSHLRDLNSRPTVYENAGVSKDSKNIDPLGGSIVGRFSDLDDLAFRAREALASLACGEPHALRRAVDVLAVVAGLTAASGRRTSGGAA